MHTSSLDAVRHGASFAVLGLVLFWGNAALAQQVPVSSSSETDEVQARPSSSPASDEPAISSKGAQSEIVVTGIRQSLANALDAKRQSAQVLDAISAEDIGKFPDKNVGEALQRVTGVQISRSGGEGSGVSIRGANPSLNRVEINGQTVLGTGAGSASRSVEFRDIPAEFVSRLEVVKSATPDMTEGGLGGTVRIITRRPFDRSAKDGYLAGSAQVVYSDVAHRWDPKFAVIGSRLFAHDTLGLLISATYEKRSLWYDQARTTGWRQIEAVQPATPTSQNCLNGRNQARCIDLDGNGFGDFFPDIPRYAINRELTERYAVNGILEWRPTDRIHSSLEGTYTRGKQSLNSQFISLGTGQAVTGGGVNPATTTLGGDQTVSYVEFDNASTLPSGLNVNYRNILGSIDRQQYSIRANVEWEVTDKFKVSGNTSYARARAYNNEIDTSSTAQTLGAVIIDYSGPQHAPNLIAPDFDVTKTQGLTTFQVLRRPRYNLETEKNFKLDAEWKPGAWLTSLKAGVQKRDLDVTSRLYDGTKTYNAYVAATPGFGNITLADYNTPDRPGTSVAIVQSAPGTAAVLQQIQEITSHFDLGDHVFFHTGNLGFNGITRWVNLGDDVANAAGVPDPFVNPNPADTWGVFERNLAAYVQASFALRPAGIEISGVVGGRVVNTKTRTNGFVIVGPSPATDTSAAALGRVDPFSSRGEYTEFLPSLNLRAELVPNKVILRATATEVIARPSPADLAPRFTLDNVGFTGSRGNPALEPYRARQYDLGAEWYIDRTDFLSVAFFRKDISSFVDRTTAPETVGGVVYTVSRPINGSSRVQINGVEIGSQVAFEFLPSLLRNTGVTANYTYSKDSGYDQKDYFTGASLSFPGLSRHSVNFSGYYEDKTFSLRASYNWRSRYLISALDRGNNPSFGEPFGQWDASASVNISDHLSIFLEGVNLFESQRIEDANSVYRRNIIETYGRRIYAGVRAKL